MRRSRFTLPSKPGIGGRVATVLERYSKYSQRRRRHAARAGQRLDIQGLRMVAVLTVLANHLWGWPEGGFVGVDVFFVISGFLITGNLLRHAEKRGNVSFRAFYLNRIRRIVPAATVVLLLTYLAAVALFLPFRSQQVGVDGLFAFLFLSNWWFGHKGTDYFAAAASMESPLLHFWSLSIEEQFYFVWPALIFAVSAVVLRRAWSHQRRMQLAGAVMAAVVATSLTFSIWQTANSPVAAYFNTFARVWELGVGALLACAVGALAVIPRSVRPTLSWAGLALIAASLVLIGDSNHGFPAPWALLPVTGAALVIVAGVGEEPSRQAFLRNPVSGYIGDISYSLYLVHWPVIVFLGSLMKPGLYFSLVALALSFGLAIASYHFLENPLRRSTWPKLQSALHEIRKRRWRPQPNIKYAALGSSALIVAALTFAVVQPVEKNTVFAPELTATGPLPATAGAAYTAGPLTIALQNEITAALKAREWPALQPSLESIAGGDQSATEPGIPGCGGTVHQRECTWGSPSAPTKIVIVGNSVAIYYVQPLREIALNSNGQIQIHTLAMPGCHFVDEPIFNADDMYLEACPNRKQQLIDYINTARPTVVVMSHNYATKQVVGTDHFLSAAEWTQTMRAYVDKFPGGTKLVLLAPPPGGLPISDCFSRRGSAPEDCVGAVSNDWLAMAESERAFAKSIGGQWIDSRPWFCSPYGNCPSFVGSTPTRLDLAHLVPAYGLKIFPVMSEAMRAEGVF